MRKAIALAAALLVAATAQAGDAPQAEAAQPVVVPPEITRFEEARIPPDLAVVPGRYVVTLELTIDAAGRVADVSVKASDQSALDPLAVAAARAFEFRPATVDGTPAAVAVTYRYAFDVR
ncbi:MAG: energy transducer TonB, partial [Deltaproteobacteria bacterium]|nr:energy transducer TonB [Deltaproteobacteria bacterium]